MIKQPGDHALDTLLEELGPAEPPAGFSGSVMQQIGQHPRHGAAHIRSFSNGGSTMKKVFWGIATAAAITLAVFALRGFPPVERGTEGTIGAAQKYQAAQLSDKDVVLGDTAAQAFLQTAAFDRLIKDPQARQLLSNAAVQDALRNGAFATAIRSADVRATLHNEMVARIFADAAASAELEAALTSNMVAGARANAVAGIKAGAVAQVLNDASLSSALSNSAVRAAMRITAFRDAMSHAELAAALNNASFLAAIQNAGFAAALNRADVRASLASR